MSDIRTIAQTEKDQGKINAAIRQVVERANSIIGLSNNAVTNAYLADMAAWTFKMRNAGTTGDPSDVDLSTLTEKTTPALADILLLLDSAASNQPKKLQRGNLLRFKIGSATRDATTATGTQAITGVGFAPKFVILLAAINNTSQLSVGWSDATTHQCIYDNHAANPDTHGTVGSSCIFMELGGGPDRYSATISAMGSDGFTFSWTKTGSPTGTIQVFYLAIA